MPDGRTSEYHVYVVELDDAAAPTSTGKCVYVGETNLTPQARFEKHKAGHKAARKVRDFGIRLLPQLTQGIGPFATREESLAAERALCEDLRRRGFTVFGGQGMPFMTRSKAKRARK